jgi:hypothetical protein
VDRSVPEPRDAEEQETERERGFRRRCEDKVPNYVDCAAEREAEGDIVRGAIHFRIRVADEIFARKGLCDDIMRDEEYQKGAI